MDGTYGVKSWLSSSTGAASSSLSDIMDQERQSAWEEEDGEDDVPVVQGKQPKHLWVMSTRQRPNPNNSRAASRLLGDVQVIDSKSSPGGRAHQGQDPGRSSSSKLANIPPPEAFSLAISVVEGSGDTICYSANGGASRKNFHNSSSPEGKQRKTKMDKIRELKGENERLQEGSDRLQKQLDEKEELLKELDVAHFQDTVQKKGNPQDSEKLHEALRSLTSLTRRQFKEISKQRKMIAAMEQQVIQNHEEIEGLRAVAERRKRATESAHVVERAKLIDLTKELALTKAGSPNASDDMKDMVGKIRIYEEELIEKDKEISRLQKEMKRQKELILRLHFHLARTKRYAEDNSSMVKRLEQVLNALPDSFSF